MRMDLRVGNRCLGRINSFDFLSCLSFLYLRIHLVHRAITVVNQNVKVTHKIGMTIFNLKVKDLNGFVEFKEGNALNSCRAPILGVNNILGCKTGCVNPAFAFDMERVRFGTPDNLPVDVKFNQSVYLIYGSCDNLLFSGFTCDMINAGNRISDLNSLDSLLPSACSAETRKLYHIQRCSSRKTPHLAEFRRILSSAEKK